MSKDILEFQIYDFREENIFPQSNDSDSEDENALPKYVIHTFGKTMDGKSVYCKVTDYTPYFFVELPEDWDKKKAKKNIKHMKNYLTSKYNNKVYPRKYKDGLIDIKLVEKLKPQGFTNGKKFLFALLVFNNEISRKKFANIFNPSVRLRCPECGKNKIDGLKSEMIGNKYELTKLKCSNCEHTWEKKIFKHCLTIPKIRMKPIHYPIYESNFPAFLRCFHIRNIKGCGWVKVDSKDVQLPLGIETFKEYESTLEFSNQDSMELEDAKESLCKYEFSIKWNKLEPTEKEGNAPLIIASFDIECDSIDGQFPQAKRSGDKVIQIGTTYTYIGQSVPFRQHIVCLKETNDVEGAIVESYQTEKDLMRGWLEEIQRSDCDIITGWNIFYFDEKYIYDRCENLLGYDNINYLSKLKEHHCNFKEMKLASSAMGENLLRFWETPGRVHIDLMKDVQNNFNLTSYKLDNVSAEFIRGGIEEIKLKNKTSKKAKKYLLKCSSINDINVDDFIHIELLKSFVSDNVGKKYRVEKIDEKTKTLTIKTDFDIINELEILGEGKLFWSQAKDDVGPKDIFRLQKGSADDRAVVAKYCVKDCRLVNLLINKLEVVTRCIEMANVCSIPMYFLFTRGQGIKLFSLCSKFYRDFGFVFPVLKKPIVNPGSYEGAIVFDPIASATYEALCTKDYASLYPSSILHKNMSHETKVIDDKYDNLPGIEYYNARFVDNDGSIQYRRFAKVDKKYGVIPTILDTLLKERKSVKKQMKVEKDPFKKSILDGKQLALKITANSLYGQLGAGTSPVRDRDIAACTTSTGREMLIFAKKYDEEFLPYIINGLKYARINQDSETFNKIIEQELKNFSNEVVIDINRYLDEYEKVISLPVIKYGDSVIGDTPLLLKNKKTNMVMIKKIKDLASSWGNYHNGKESAELSKYMTWTETGWKDIKRVIRHKLDKNKKLLKIQTHHGITVVTDEHSLLDESGGLVDASKVKVGTKLLHSYPTEYPEEKIVFYDREINEKIAYMLGFFMGDGSCGYYKNCDKSSFAFNNKDKNVLVNLKEICDENFNEYKWKILDTLESSNVYKLVPGVKLKENKVKDLILYFRKKFYNNEKEKQVPTEILNSPYNIRKAFWIGMYEADGFKTNFGKITKEMNDKNNDINLISKSSDSKIRCGQQIDQKGSQVSAGLYYLAKSLGFKVSLNSRDDKKNIYRIRVSNSLRKEPDLVKKISEWKYTEEYVYDLTTEDHHFQAGVGCMIVHNTDSVFTSFRYRNDVDIIEQKSSLKLFKKIIKFGGKLMEQFLFDDNLDIWKSNFKKYYSFCNIKKLIIPEGPEVPPHPDHWKTILPLETRVLQFMKEYVELMWLPWLWTLQDLFLEEYNDLSYLKKKQYHEILEVKIFRKANSLLEMMRIIPEELSEGKKDIIVTMIKKFISEELSQEWIQPYWVYNKKLDKFDNCIKFYQGGYKITEKRCLDLSIDLGIISGELVKSRLPPPHDLEYEKCFWPFIILTKKRYVGNKYEFDKNKYKMNYMGIVLKRRDNAPIVKEVCEGIITRLLNDKSPSMAKKFTKKCMKDMFAGKYDIKYFLTSKTLKLKESYKDWTRIAHVVLADRIAKRDPGNKPQSGDRIEYAAICLENETKNTLQGERIETPKFIKEQNLSIDYLFYMTNQIRNPATQFLELVIKNAERIFDRFKVKAENKKKGQIDILNFVKVTKKKTSDSDELSSITPTDVTELFTKRLKDKKKSINLDV